VFLTTHNMFIADELCHRVGFIVDGVLKVVDSPRNLKLKYGQPMVEVEYGDNGQLLTVSLSLEEESDKEKLTGLIQGGKIQRMHTKEPTLEEIFIRLTGRGLE